MPEIKQPACQKFYMIVILYFMLVSAMLQKRLNLHGFEQTCPEPDKNKQR